MDLTRDSIPAISFERSMERVSQLVQDVSRRMVTGKIELHFQSGMLKHATKTESVF